MRALTAILTTFTVPIELIRSHGFEISTKSLLKNSVRAFYALSFVFEIQVKHQWEEPEIPETWRRKTEPFLALICFVPSTLCLISTMEVMWEGVTLQPSKHCLHCPKLSAFCTWTESVGFGWNNPDVLTDQWYFNCKQFNAAKLNACLLQMTTSASKKRNDMISLHSTTAYCGCQMIWCHKFSLRVIFVGLYYQQVCNLMKTIKMRKFKLNTTKKDNPNTQIAVQSLPPFIAWKPPHFIRAVWQGNSVSLPHVTNNQTGSNQ